MNITGANIYNNIQHAIVEPVKFERQPSTENIKDNRDSNAPSTGYSSTSVVDQGQPPMDENTSPSSTSHLCPAPLCRQFWKAGNYDDELSSKTTTQSGRNYLHVHPKFLHSNATSHKWVFGAIAELLDNAIDEWGIRSAFVRALPLFKGPLEPSLWPHGRVLCRLWLD